MRSTLLFIVLAISLPACKRIHVEKDGSRADSNTRDLTFFLHRLRTLDHLPELEASHTSLASTWDTNGLNNDGNYFKDIRDTVNILLDKDGPGCIHRIFTGSPTSRHMIPGYRYLLTETMNRFSMCSYATFLIRSEVRFPIPWLQIKHIPVYYSQYPMKNISKYSYIIRLSENWGNYWQVAYTTYPENIKVKSITYPFSEAEKGEIQKVINAWLEAERNLPAMPEKWPFKQKMTIKAGEKGEISLNGTGIIKQLYITAIPNKSEAWRNTRFIVYWDANEVKSIDVPLGYFFGNADYASMFQYNSMLTGITADGAYSLFPMPYEKGAKMVFFNQNKEDMVLEVNMNIEERKNLQPEFGRFHATFTEVKPYGKNYDSLPRFGKSPKPFLITLQKNRGPGKICRNLRACRLAAQGHLVGRRRLADLDR